MDSDTHHTDTHGLDRSFKSTDAHSDLPGGGRRLQSHGRGEWAAPQHGDGHDEKTRRMIENANGDSYAAALRSRAAELWREGGTRPAIRMLMCPTSTGKGGRQAPRMRQELT